MPNELLKVRNATAYDTRDIRSAVLACEKYLDLRGARDVKVVYSRNRTRSVSGYAYYPSAGRAEGCGVRLRLPKIQPGQYIDELLTCEFLWLVEHELSHSRGVRHPELRGGCAGKVHGQLRRPNWAEGLQLRLKAPKAKPTPIDRVARRAAKVDADLARWERRLKLAKTKVAKLKAKQRYYLLRAGKLLWPEHFTPQPTLMAAKRPSKE
jgi:hypothetical protein